MNEDIYLVVLFVFVGILFGIVSFLDSWPISGKIIGYLAFFIWIIYILKYR